MKVEDIEKIYLQENTIELNRGKVWLRYVTTFTNVMVKICIYILFVWFEIIAVTSIKEFWIVFRLHIFQ